MSDVFISYARSTEAQARQIGEALRALGHSVWRDDELPAHQDYSRVIEERLRAAKAVVVVWSAEAIKSQWVCAEADVAREAGTLVQLNLDAAVPPLPFNRIQCADMRGWSGDLDAPGWRKVAASVADLVGAKGDGHAARAPAAQARKLSVCVLPFTNISDDPQQEYFSDGISEDIITDLSKVSALQVTARNSAFAYKGKSPDLRQVARELNVSHVLEGSVRKAGARVRITAQLIDGDTGNHLWAERYDRDLTDIFALQDEISEAIVRALKLKLLPEEKKAIERRGTDNAEAYDLYLMARQHSSTSNFGVSEMEAVVRLASRAVEIDPAYARAWALIGSAQSVLRFRHGRRDIGSSAAVERALALDPDLAEAHAARADDLRLEGRFDEASEEIETALRLDPDCYEANNGAASLFFNQGRIADAIPYWEKAASLMEADGTAPAMLVTCYAALGDTDGARQAARIALARAEAVIGQDRGNGTAMSYGVNALAVLGEADRARDWIRRALLIDPDNQNMRVNFACALSAHLKDTEGALDLLGPYLAQVTRYDLNWTKTDPDFEPIRDDPRFRAMIAEAEARLAAETGSDAAPA
ncbi:MAG TPA: TIR domain-containing protein [Caulobacteraceae bacterium]|jgi:adenylate cyclase